LPDDFHIVMLEDTGEEDGFPSEGFGRIGDSDLVYGA
jgi:hypothetical protein